MAIEISALFTEIWEISLVVFFLLGIESAIFVVNEPDFLKINSLANEVSYVANLITDKGIEVSIDPGENWNVEVKDEVLEINKNNDLKGEGSVFSSKINVVKKDDLIIIS